MGEQPQTGLSGHIPVFAHPVTEKSDKEVVADKETESIIHTAFKKIVQGKPLDDFEGEINPETRFYILACPNSQIVRTVF